MANCGIYAIHHSNKMEAYIGQSVNIEARLRGHFNSLRRGTHSCIRLQRAFNKYGENSFYPVILAGDLDPLDTDVLTLLEQEWMDYVAKDTSLYNTCPAAGSRAGAKLGDEGRARCSVGQKRRFENPEERAKQGLKRLGIPSPWKGKTPSDETRMKMSLAAKNRPSNFKGRHHSEESIKKMSLNRAGKPSNNKGKSRSKESNLKQSNSMKAHWEDPVTRQRQSELRTIAWRNQVLSDETRQKLSDAANKRWAAYRELRSK
jgi:group I intron endonuclease